MAGRSLGFGFASFGALLVSAAVCAQNAVPLTDAANAVRQVEGLAPQLVSFAGSRENFRNLVIGLTQGTAVTLVSATPDGATLIATFTPAGSPLTATQTAQALEATRQQLIGLGISTPSAEQLGIALQGGAIPIAPTSSNRRAAVSPAQTLQQRSSPLASAGRSRAINGSSVQIQVIAPLANTSDSPRAGNTSDSPRSGNLSDSPRSGNLSDSPRSGNTSDSARSAPAAGAPSIAAQNQAAMRR